MPSQDVTKYEVRGRGAWITLDAPQSRNALRRDDDRSILFAQPAAALCEGTVNDEQQRPEGEEMNRRPARGGDEKSSH